MEKSNFDKTIVFIYTFFLLSVNISKGVGITGYYITKSDDTIQTTFAIPYSWFEDVKEMEVIYKEVTIYENHRNPRTFKPTDIKGFCFIYENKRTEMKSVHNTLYPKFGEYLFMEIAVNGKAKLLEMKFKRNKIVGTTMPFENGGNNFSGKIIEYIEVISSLQMLDGELIKVNNRNFFKRMKLFFNDCQDIIDGLKDRTYTLENVKNMTMYYNMYCK